MDLDLTNKEVVEQRLEKMKHIVHSMMKSMTLAQEMTKSFGIQEKLIKEFGKEEVTHYDKDDDIYYINEELFQKIFWDKLENELDAYMLGFELSLHNFEAKAMIEKSLLVEPNHQTQFTHHAENIMKEFPEGLSVIEQFIEIKKRYFFDVNTGHEEIMNVFFVLGLLIGYNFNMEHNSDNRMELNPDITKDSPKSPEEEVELQRTIEFGLAIGKKLDQLVHSVKYTPNHQALKDVVFSEFTTPEEWFFVTIASYNGFVNLLTGQKGELVDNLFGSENLSNVVDKYDSVIAIIIEEMNMKRTGPYGYCKVFESKLEQIEESDRKYFMAVGAMMYMSMLKQAQ